MARRRRDFRTIAILAGVLLGAAALPAFPGAADAGPARQVETHCRTGAPACVQVGHTAARSHGATTDQRGRLSGSPFRELQMNLCNSGHAGCYQQGRSIPEAQSLISGYQPDLVTVNEVCGPDVTSTLYGTMLDTFPDDEVFYAFMPAWNRATDAPYQCTDGRGDYGIGILGRVPAGQWAGAAAVGDYYPDQDTSSNEVRAWACVYAIGNYYGCTTHLVSTDSSIAMAQCQYLMSHAIPTTWDLEGAYQPTVVGGDLNLRYQGSPNVQDCVPSGWFRKGDGDVQHVLATDDFTFDSSQKIGMWYTDHPAWLVDLTYP